MAANPTVLDKLMSFAQDPNKAEGDLRKALIYVITLLDSRLTQSEADIATSEGVAAVLEARVAALETRPAP